MLVPIYTSGKRRYIIVEEVLQKWIKCSVELSMCAPAETLLTSGKVLVPRFSSGNCILVLKGF